MTRVRKRLEDDAAQGEEVPPEQEESGSPAGDYFVSPTDVEFFSTGCAVLDCVLGGGIAENRLINIVGSSSTGKTLIAIEGISNFLAKHPDGYVRYTETEAAFDLGYAEALGIPIHKVDFFQDCATVEELFEDLEEVIEHQKEADHPALYIVDSLDALSDKAEMDRAIDAGSYGMTKAKQLSELLRRVNARLSKSRVTLLVISQVRDNITASFGEKLTRAGGRALKFYASQELWLAHLQTVKKTVKGVERPVAARIKAKVKKNKVGMPFRECTFDIVYGYGVDDLKANLEFLAEVKQLDRADPDAKDWKRLAGKYNKLDDDEFFEVKDRISEITKQVWKEIESNFRPKRRKY